MIEAARSLQAPMFAAAQIIGTRARQEDYYGVVDLSDAGAERVVFVVADGMGGHIGAAEAARRVVETFCNSVRDGAGPLSERLRTGLDKANAALQQPNEALLQGAGSTMLAAAVEQGKLTWISVGDSALLLFRDGRIRRLNEDHSLPIVVNAAAPMSHTSAKPARRRQLRAAVAGRPLELVDECHQPVPLYTTDQILIATDGLETLSHDAIAVFLRRTVNLLPHASVARLIKRLARSADQDNTTIILYRPAATAQSMSTNSRRFPLFALLTTVLFLAAVIVAWTVL